jgi:hypothetical protein
LVVAIVGSILLVETGVNIFLLMHGIGKPIDLFSELQGLTFFFCLSRATSIRHALYVTTTCLEHAHTDRIFEIKPVL